MSLARENLHFLTLAFLLLPSFAFAAEISRDEFLVPAWVRDLNEQVLSLRTSVELAGIAIAKNSPAAPNPPSSKETRSKSEPKENEPIPNALPSDVLKPKSIASSPFSGTVGEKTQETADNSATEGANENSQSLSGIGAGNAKVLSKVFESIGSGGTLSMGGLKNGGVLIRGNALYGQGKPQDEKNSKKKDDSIQPELQPKGTTFGESGFNDTIPSLQPKNASNFLDKTDENTLLEDLKRKEEEAKKEKEKKELEKMKEKINELVTNPLTREKYNELGNMLRDSKKQVETLAREDRELAQNVNRLFEKFGPSDEDDKRHKAYAEFVRSQKNRAGGEEAQKLIAPRPRPKIHQDSVHSGNR